MTTPEKHNMIKPLLWQASNAAGEVLKARTETVNYTITATKGGKFEAVWNSHFNISHEKHSDIGPAIRECQEDFEIRTMASLSLRSFQPRVRPWMDACFGPEILADTTERNHRFLEEALELVQACGCTADESHQLVDYVFGRHEGDASQEVGGVMVTLAALCLAQSIDMHDAGETELARVWTKIDQIRAKQAAKPKHSPLPQ